MDKVIRLKNELSKWIKAYDTINQEHTMMLGELGLPTEIKPTREIIRKAISSFHGGTQDANS